MARKAKPTTEITNPIISSAEENPEHLAKQALHEEMKHEAFAKMRISHEVPEILRDIQDYLFVEGLILTFLDNCTGFIISQSEQFTEIHTISNYNFQSTDYRRLHIGKPMKIESLVDELKAIDRILISGYNRKNDYDKIITIANRAANGYSNIEAFAKDLSIMADLNTKAE